MSYRFRIPQWKRLHELFLQIYLTTIAQTDLEEYTKKDTEDEIFNGIHALVDTFDKQFELTDYWGEPAKEMVLKLSFDEK